MESVPEEESGLAYDAADVELVEALASLADVHQLAETSLAELEEASKDVLEIAAPPDMDVEELGVLRLVADIALVSGCVLELVGHKLVTEVKLEVQVKDSTPGLPFVVEAVLSVARLLESA